MGVTKRCVNRFKRSSLIHSNIAIQLLKVYPLRPAHNPTSPPLLSPCLETPCPPCPPCPPTLTPQLPDEVNTPTPYSDVKFSSDGKYLLGVVEGRVYVMDAFNGTVVRK